MKVIKYIILYLVPVPEPQLITVPVPTFNKLRFHKAKSYGSYGSGSGSTTLHNIYLSPMDGFVYIVDQSL
jgi:hypothetical protein